MPRSRRRKQRQKSNNPTQKGNSPFNPLIISAPGIKHPIDLMFYLPGRCAICEREAATLLCTAWRNDAGKSYGCSFCIRCTITVMAKKSQQERGDFYRDIELRCDCELAGDAIAESEVGK